MFFQRDYVLRMIEMMGDFMRRISELLSDLERTKLLDDACQKHTGLSLETAEALSGESLEEMLSPVPRLMMSELLYIRAESTVLTADQQQKLLLKSLHLLSSLFGEGALCELRAQRLLTLKKELWPYLREKEFLNCARFFQEAELYADMEDALFQAVDLFPKSPQRKELIQEGLGLLQRAADASTEALLLAHTSREELLESAIELQNRTLP